MNISVECKHVTPLEILVQAIRQCYESGDKSDSGYNLLESEYGSQEVFCLGDKDAKLINRIIESNHTSTLEHITFNFNVKGISRLVLQELARHRIASYSVKSTRYTLKELKTVASFVDFGVPYPYYDYDAAAKYINLLGIPAIDQNSILALEGLRELVASGLYTNDEVKYALPECYKLDLYMSFNARSLQNFFTLRMSQKAHFEIQELAHKTYNSMPDDYKFLFKI